MDKVDKVFNKLAKRPKHMEGLPEFEEVAPKKDVQRGSAIVGGVLGSIPSAILAGGVVTSYTNKPKLKALGVYGAGTALGAFIGRHTLGSDKQYEKARKSYISQMKDPEHKKKFLEANNYFKEKKN